MVLTDPLSVWHLYLPESNGETFEIDKKSPSTSGWVEGVLMFTKNSMFYQIIGGSALLFCEESEEKHPILTSCPSYSMMVWFGYWVGINNADEHSQLVPENECPILCPRIQSLSVVMAGVWVRGLTVIILNKNRFLIHLAICFVIEICFYHPVDWTIAFQRILNKNDIWKSIPVKVKCNFRHLRVLI